MIGSSTIRQIMNIGCDTIDKFYQLKSEQFQDVPKVGPIKAECLANGLQQSKFIVDRLFELGVKIKDKVSGGKLDGKSVNFTGTMINKRAVLEQMVVDNGGSVKSVGKDLTYLVVDDVDSTTTKIQKAKKLGIKLITEDEFLNLLK
jgi:DNA ligase (NAD+)